MLNKTGLKKFELASIFFGGALFCSYGVTHYFGVNFGASAFFLFLLGVCFYLFLWFGFGGAGE